MRLKAFNAALFALVAIGTLCAGVPAFSSTNETLAVGTIPSSDLFGGPATMTMRRLTIAPGEVLGWQYHHSALRLIAELRGSKGEWLRDEFASIVARFAASRHRNRSPLALNTALYAELLPWFERHHLDCNERVLLHLEAAATAGIPLPNYARAENHAGLLFEPEGKVLDPFDGQLHSIAEFALGAGDGYFMRSPTSHCIVEDDRRCRVLTAEERPSLVTPNEPHASLLLDAAATANDARIALHAVRLDPRNADAHDTIAGLAADRGAWDLAEKEYAAALALNPHDARIRFNHAVYLQMCGSRDLAIAEYRESLRLQPRLLPAMENLGMLLGTTEGRELLKRAMLREHSARRVRQLQGATLRASIRPRRSP
jgi:tetratricopeptide (TPR) repeat protein